ncbi:MAG: DNA replication and repair protein RecF [Candidatus Gracilibacteria bacterium]|nr:DNA replication and repair protein RecF [Candidatus Gracilibacteria bacterium]
MLQTLRLFQFKNHSDISFDFEDINLIYGPNGSGKTNILESIYLLVNGKLPSNHNVSNLISTGKDNFLVCGGSVSDFMHKELKMTGERESNKLNFIVNKTVFTKAKYLQSKNDIALFFSPMEVNIVYLGPTLRRDFLDEAISLAFTEFTKIRSDYIKILRNRNRLLKDISEGKAAKADLVFWDDSFIRSAANYYLYRKRFIDYVKSNMETFSRLLGSKYELEFFYESKVDLDDIGGSIRSYLSKNIDRDIILGHTYIGPHLDDFYFNVILHDEKMKSQDYLSRGENKSLLIGLKFLEISFLESIHEKNIILLLDDIFSELDDVHVALVMEKCRNYQTFITSQNIPIFPQFDAQFKKININ